MSIIQNGSSALKHDHLTKFGPKPKPQLIKQLPVKSNLNIEFVNDQQERKKAILIELEEIKRRLLNNYGTTQSSPSIYKSINIPAQGYPNHHVKVPSQGLQVSEISKEE